MTREAVVGRAEPRKGPRKGSESPSLALRIGVVLSLLCASSVRGQDLGQLAPDVLSKEQRKEARGMIDRWIKQQLKDANERHLAAWYKVKTREDWEKFRDVRIERLRQSLGSYPRPGKFRIETTGVVAGDGFRIENIVYETRPGDWVTANLYTPAKPGKAMPGLLIAHAHHRDKPQQELQDMGMTWARSGCLVLVIDQVGYGERRSHPFNSAADYAGPFKVPQQDYYFRYDSGIQLQLLGDSLMGWMVWDLMRGVDLLLARDGVDPKKIIILGAVAGGGDPAGVTAALDQRIACCVPFNFGGAQPENRYPLPEDAETSFNYAGWTYFDSTRGLRLSVRDDFLHWVIVASTAPRHLIHAHEFAWDKVRDPVWKRYQKIWGEFYGAGDRLGASWGKGNVKLSPPEATHCTNIGRYHRQMIHPLFDQWFGIKVTDKDEYSAVRKREELTCWTDKARQNLQPAGLLETMAKTAGERVRQARAGLEEKSPQERRALLREQWQQLLGPIAPQKPAVVKARTVDDQTVDGAKVERILLEVEPGIVVPVMVLVPVNGAGRMPVVVGVSQAGKAGFLKERTDEVRKLIRAGTIVVLPDVRGTGETGSGDGRGKRGADTNHSVYAHMFGETILGQRLRDLRSVLAYVRTRNDVRADKLAIWGDSFAAANGPDTNYKVPREIDVWPLQSEPLGGLLGLLAGLFEDNVQGIYLGGSLASYHQVLTHYAVLIPHDASVPGALTTGDLCDLAGSLSPLPLRFEMTVDHLNRIVPLAALEKEYAPALKAHAMSKSLNLSEQRTSAGTFLLAQLK